MDVDDFMGRWNSGKLLFIHLQESNQMDILGTTLEIEFLVSGIHVSLKHGIMVPSVMGRMLLRRFFGHDDVTTLPLFLLDSSERIWSETQSIFGLRTNLEPTLSPSKNTDRFGRVLLNAFGVAELKLNISQLRRVERWICCMCNHYSEVSGYAGGLCDQGTVQKTRRELRKGVRRGVWGGIYHFMLIQKQTSNEKQPGCLGYIGDLCWCKNRWHTVDGSEIRRENQLREW